jgi:GR25 family glycosyltransferase involved in LPS biosynthesis
MKAYVITMKDYAPSTKGANICIESIKKHQCNLDVKIFDATTTKTLDSHVSEHFTSKHWKDLWTFPWKEQGSRKDEKSGLSLSWYSTRVKEKRVACFMSHYRLWKKCIKLDQPIMILEHDALFSRQFNYNDIASATGWVIGLNDPFRNTYRFEQFNEGLVKEYKKLNTKDTACIESPWIAESHVPQGIAGNSAYIIKPEACKRLLELVNELGMWPNDAVMCKQLLDNQLQCAYPYYTSIQRMPSTTAR